MNSVMDISYYTRIVSEKLQRFEPEHATRIIGYLLLQENGEQEVVKLASYPDPLIREVAFKARNELQRLNAKSAILPISLPGNAHQQELSQPIISPRTPFQFSFSCWDTQPVVSNTNAEFMPIGFLDSIPELQKQTPLFSLENHLDSGNSSSSAGNSNEYFGLEASNLGVKTGRRFSSLSEFPVKTCHYFNKGYCKHGNNCRYYHGQVVPDMFSQMYGNDGLNDDQVISPSSLAQLESEIVELLKPRRGNPISIASLPMAYYDKYKKVLQAEGYLTESQRHGKSGYSLTKLLARLKNSIRLIDRPHGQHSVVLAEDAPKIMGKGDFGQHISASRQIYLTFPAESTFTEEDVSNYFSTFGSVEDVRIPCQQRRMFGFVTFVDPETVKMILEKGNPHYVRGSRVLVKPYKEKPKLIDRKYQDRVEPSVCYSPHYVDIDTELTSIQRSCGNPRFLRRLLEEQEQVQALEFQRRRLAELQLAQNSLSTSPHFGFNMDVLKEHQAIDSSLLPPGAPSMDSFMLPDPFNFQSAQFLNYTSNDKSKYTETNHTDEEDSQGLNLPDNTFAFLDS